MMTLLKKNRILLAVIAALIIAIQIPSFAASIDSELGENEIKMGKEAAEQIAKDNKLSDNAADLKRVREIGDRIAKVANQEETSALYGSSKVVPFNYEFNIIEQSDVNAFCVPAGHIYIYRGLLDFVESDQELAGVIAHEITHAAHHHMIYLLKKQAAADNQMAIAVLAMALGGVKAEDLGNIQLAIQLYQIAKVNGYGMEAERDSDRSAITYMIKAGYNPVGLLTFMEKLARRPEFVTYGIYQNHPLDAERVEAAKQRLIDLKVPINRRATTKAIKAEVKIDTVNNDKLPGVYIQDKLIYRPAPLGSKSAEKRANEAADRINDALDANIKIHELSSSPDSGTVAAAGKVLMTVTDADAKLMGKSTASIVKDASAAIRDVVWKQMVDTVH